jgi:DNA-binding MarR family transcriptional regulator
MNSSDRELDALERIQQSQNPVRQRDLARIIGLSLGMTNAILKRLAQKGLLQVQKVNNRNIQYVVSPKGMEEIAHRSYRYLKRTIKNVVYYKEAIDRLIQGIGSQGFQRLVLVGNSDLDFIVEHLCHKHHLAYERSPVPPVNTVLAHDPGQSGVKAFVLYSENSRLPNAGAADCASLRFLFGAQPPAPAFTDKMNK